MSPIVVMPAARFACRRPQDATPSTPSEPWPALSGFVLVGRDLDANALTATRLSPPDVVRRFGAVVLASVLTTVAEWSSIVSVLGLGIAIWQVVRTRNAVTAAKAAIERTERHLAVNQLLVLVPQLQRLEPELNIAITANSREAVIRHLAEWRRLAGDVYGLSKDEKYGDQQLLDLLQQSAASAATAKRRMLDASSDLLKTSGPALRDIDAACEALAQLSGQLKRYSGGVPDGD